MALCSCLKVYCVFAPFGLFLCNVYFQFSNMVTGMWFDTVWHEVFEIVNSSIFTANTNKSSISVAQ